jgi:hypothetical protein
MGLLDFVLRGPEKDDKNEKELDNVSVVKEQEKSDTIFQGGYIDQRSLLKKVRKGGEEGGVFPYEKCRYRVEMGEIEKELFANKGDSFSYNKQGLDNLIRSLKAKLPSSNGTNKLAIMDYIKILEELNK